MPLANRVLLSDDPFAARSDALDWGKRGTWPASWVACDGMGAPPFVTAYRLRFTLPPGGDGADAKVRVHATADERYVLYVDGTEVARGSERGEPDHWLFDTFDLDLTPGGEHVFVAVVWSLGPDRAPYAQMSVRPGFLLAAEGDEATEAALSTGRGAWEAKPVGGYAFHPPLAAWGTGDNITLDGRAYPWGVERGDGDGWSPVVPAGSASGGDGGPKVDMALAGDGWRKNELPQLAHRLRPALLLSQLSARRQVGTVRLVAALSPDGSPTHPLPVRAADNLEDEQATWQALVGGGGSVTIPARSRRRVLLDLDDYYCAYPELTASGGAGATVRVHWQETLYNEPNARTKGDRSAVEGKYFVTVWQIKDGIGDTFLLEGGADRFYTTLWWQCGRYVEIVVETAEEPLTISGFALRETRYPLENTSEFAANDDRLQSVIPLMTRVLQMCAHETYMDCPYFEQLMYAGDTRLEVLATYCVTGDDKLPRKALQAFDWSRTVSFGGTQSRYPSRVRQTIPPFALWWVGMVHDYALWRDDAAFVRGLLPGVRSVLDAFLSYVGPNDNLLVSPEGWNYVDWVPAWRSGIPPGADCGQASGVLNLHLVYTLRLAALLEDWHGEPELAGRCRRRADEIAEATIAAFWNIQRGLFADDRAHTSFSEHAQCLAILGGVFAEPTVEARIAHNLVNAPDLHRTTIYFTHYLFETFHALGLPDALLSRLGLWFDLPAQGFKTTFEEANWNTTRSDCHAWGAHPLYHYFATLLGVRPGGAGFASVQIAPSLGELTWLKGKLPHPKGFIEADLRREGDRLVGTITLPPGVPGVLFDADTGGVQITGDGAPQAVDVALGGY